MQKGSKEDLLKILKDYRNLQGFTPKINEDNLNDFKSNSESLENIFESFKNASEREIEPQDSSEDLNGDQLKAE